MTTLPSLIFLDGADPAETTHADEMLKVAGHSGIMGQTTNPSLIAKNPDVMKYVVEGKKLTTDEALREYRKIVEAIAKVTSGPISIQVIADHTTSKEEMLRQAKVYQSWIPNGVVKFPCTYAGLEAASEYCKIGSINITLNFSQDQAAAVHLATMKPFDSAQGKNQVYISPFVGRLDDVGENGMDVVVNILRMYQNVSSHVKVLTASVRKLDHIFYALFLKSAAVTIPKKLLTQWADMRFTLPLHSYRYLPVNLRHISYKELDLTDDWRDFDLSHPLTDSGLTKFMEDWKSIVK